MKEKEQNTQDHVGTAADGQSTPGECHDIEVASLEAYNVTVPWNPEVPSEGNYATTAWAADASEATRRVAEEMAGSGTIDFKSEAARGAYIERLIDHGGWSTKCIDQLNHDLAILFRDDLFPDSVFRSIDPQAFAHMLAENRERILLLTDDEIIQRAYQRALAVTNAQIWKSLVSDGVTEELYGYRKFVVSPEALRVFYEKLEPNPAQRDFETFLAVVEDRLRAVVLTEAGQIISGS